jgi:hypothetical protein
LGKQARKGSHIIRTIKCRDQTPDFLNLPQRQAIRGSPVVLISVIPLNAKLVIRKGHMGEHVLLGALCEIGEFRLKPDLVSDNAKATEIKAGATRQPLFLT